MGNGHVGGEGESRAEVGTGRGVGVVVMHRGPSIPGS